MKNIGATFFFSITLVFVACGSDPSSRQDLTAHVLANFLAKTNCGAQLFSTSANGTVFVRDPRFWLRGASGLTGTHAGYGPGASAITPWHVLGANHYKREAGSKLVFCDAAGKTASRTVMAGVEIRPDIKSDIWLAVLEDALPASITPMWLMPPDWTNHAGLKPLPVAAMNQAGEFGLAELSSFHRPVKGWFCHGYSYGSSEIAPLMQFKPMHGGDSGHPIVTLVGTNLILLGHLTFEAGGTNFAGPDYSLYGPDIQSAIATLGTNGTAKAQKIRTVDLSRFE
jgi:hypothetical protein